MTDLPLALRLVNPPRPFVGRDAEARRLGEALQRSPAVGVWGLPGIGKSALVAQVLFRRFPRRAKRALRVELSAEGPPSLAGRLAGALVEAGLLAPPPGPQSEEQLLAAILDAAERRRLWVLVEGLERAAPRDEERLLGAFARYAREARLLFTSRRRLAVGAGVEQLRLEGLSEEELMVLAEVHWPTSPPEERAQRVRVAAGSPARLLRASESGPGGAFEMLQLASEAARRLVLAAALVSSRLPLSVARRLVPEARRHVRWLTRHGLLSLEARGLSCPELVRRELIACTPPSERRRLERLLGRLLCTSSSLSDWLSGIELSLARGVTESVRAFLTERGEALLDAGQAPLLYAALRRAPDPDDLLFGWKLRCAARLPSGECLDLAPKRPLVTPREAFGWAQLLLYRGEFDACADAAAHARSLARAGGDRALECRAAVVWTHARLFLDGDPRACIEHLEGLGEPPPEVRAEWIVRRAELYACALEHGRAARLLDELARSEKTLAEREVARVGWAWLAAERPRAALAWLERHGELSPAPTAVARLRRVGLQLHAAASAGERAGFEAAAETTRQMAEQLSEAQREFLAVAEADAALLRGEPARVEALAERNESRSYRWAWALHRLHLALGRAEATEMSPPVGGGAIEGREERWRWLHAERTVRLGGPRPRLAAPRTVRARASEGRVLALEALLDPRRELDEEALTRLVVRARDAGWARDELEALRLMCEAAALREGRGALRRAAERLRARAEALGALGFARDARLYRWAVERGELAELVALATEGARDWGAARRARRLLGDQDVACDRLDRRVVPALARLAQLELPEGLPTPRWLIDEARCGLWSAEDGRWVDLSTRVTLWRFVQTLLCQDGSASKEQLHRGVYDDAEYHPLRHDNRLRLTVRELRRLLGREALATTERGYALSPRVRSLDVGSRSAFCARAAG